MKTKISFGVRAVAALTVVAAPLAASASFDGPALTVTATNSFGTGSWAVSLDEFRFNSANDSYVWSLNGPVDIKNQSGDVIATLGGANAYYQEDPVIALGFLVQAGASDTHFTINSSLLSFSTINPAQGQVSAGTSLTDVDGDGAKIDAGGKLYGAYTNGFLTNLFQGLVDGSNAGSGGTATTNESFGFSPIAGGVSDMSSRWDFTLSANDMASGTSRYEVVPEPVTLVAFGLAALALKRRKQA